MPLLYAITALNMSWRLLHATLLPSITIAIYATLRDDVATPPRYADIAIKMPRYASAITLPLYATPYIRYACFLRH